MNPDHRQLVDAIRSEGRRRSPQPGANDSYNGSGHPFYGVTVPVRREIAKQWLATHRDASTDDV